MQCDKCNNESNIEIFLSNGKDSHKVSLCFSCYQKMMEEGLHEMMNGNWDDILSKYFEDSSDEFGQYSRKIDLNMSCPMCHKTIEEIVEDDKYGCQYCYSEFEPLVSKIIGKEIEEFDDNDKIDQVNDKLCEILTKKHQLEIYVNNEEYENAAILKKQIDELTKDLGTSSGSDE